MRVLLADDHRIVREGLRWMLRDEPDIDIVAEVGDGKQLLAWLRDHPDEVDVVLLDLRMPGLGGLEALERFIPSGSNPPRPAVIILSMHHEPYPGAAGHRARRSRLRAQGVRSLPHRQSIRTRLALIYMMILAAALLAFGGGIFMLLQVELQRSFAAGLVANAEHAAGALAQDVDAQGRLVVSGRLVEQLASTGGRVVVLDIAFAAQSGSSVSFEKVQRLFIDRLGSRRVAYVYHHNHDRNTDNEGDSRILLNTKAKKGS